MKLGLVIGSVVATRKTGKLDGRKIMVVRPVSEMLEPAGPAHACVDTVGAGEGDLVLLCASSSARLTAVTRDVAADSAIVGIIDSVTSGARSVYSKHLSEGL